MSVAEGFGCKSTDGNRESLKTVEWMRIVQVEAACSHTSELQLHGVCMSTIFIYVFNYLLKINSYHKFRFLINKNKQLYKYCKK